MVASSAGGLAGLPLFGDSEADRLDQLLQDIGATREQVGVATGTLVSEAGVREEGLAMVALRVRGVAAASTMARLAQLIGADVPNTAIGPQELGGKAVTAITNTQDIAEAVFLYPTGDAVFLVSGTPDLVEEALAQLP